MKERVSCGLMAAGVVYALASTSALAADAAANCESSKLGTSAKYASCRLKAEAKSAKTGDPVDYSKCTLAKFTDAETKATNAGGSCPTTTDQTTVKDHLDDCTSTAALWLAGGGGLPDACEADLVACGGDLANCEGDLSTTNADLTACEGNLSTTNADLATCEADLSTCLDDCVASVRPPLATGQTTCYNAAGSVIGCAGTGHDGQFQKGAARSFTDNGDGTITDNTTGLMWEKHSDDGTIHDKDNSYTWDNAFASKVATLNSTAFAGYTDWRVPNVTEMQTLQNFGAAQTSTFSAFNTSCAAACTVLTCSCTFPGATWSSSTDRQGPTGAWFVGFGSPGTYSGAKTNSLRVRAVRGGS